MTISVENMKSNAGNTVANQFIIHVNCDQYFQSYKSVIAMKDRYGKIYLDEYLWDYSVTTGKYRNQFLNEGIADTRKKINSGEYVLTNLN